MTAWPDQNKAPERGQSLASVMTFIVVETGASGPIGLMVDELVGQQQVVIKSLEANYRRVEGVAGATILGNGMVAMIHDVDCINAMSQHGCHLAPIMPASKQQSFCSDDGSSGRHRSCGACIRGRQACQWLVAWLPPLGGRQWRR